MNPDKSVAKSIHAKLLKYKSIILSSILLLLISDRSFGVSVQFQPEMKLILFKLLIFKV